MRRILVFTLIPLVLALMLPLTAMAAETPLTDKVIALDAGHGGKDPGAINRNPGFPLDEKDQDISVTNLLKEKLEADGAKVFLTRTGDESVELNDRVARANATKAQVMISIHHNSAKPDVNGTESYFTQADDQPVAAAMQRRLLEAFGLKDRGVKQMPDFVLTKKPAMPSAITEASFVTNDVEAHAWKYGDRVQMEATALHKGLTDYFTGR